jgi:type VI secretion system secreted protein VgrG
LKQAGEIAGGGGAALGGFVSTLASSALGFLSGGGLKSRSGVVSGPNPRKDAGTALAASGTGMGEDTGGMFSLPGVMNTVVQSFKSDSIGVARTEQIGVSKVTNVGRTFFTRVGKQASLFVEGRYEISVKDVIFSQTAKHTMVASDRIILAAPGGEIEINKEGVFIKGKIVEIKGKKINFKKGDGGCKANSPYMKE